MKARRVGRGGERTSERDDLGNWVHDGGVGSYRPSHRVRGVGEVDDDNELRLAHLLAHADELVALHRQRAEPDRRRLDTHVRQLRAHHITSHQGAHQCCIKEGALAFIYELSIKQALDQNIRKFVKE